MFRRAVGLKWRIVSAVESLVAAASIVVKKASFVEHKRGRWED